MAKTIVGLYDDRATARRVVSALKDAGFTDQHVQFASSETGDRTDFEVNASTFRDPSALTRYGIEPGEAGFYGEGLRRGGSLVVVRAQDQDAERAVDIMGEANPVRYEDRMASYRDAGYTGYDAAAPAYSADEMRAERSRYADAGTQRLQEIQEALQVGTREVVRGAVRVSSHVESEDVSEVVRLREESVRVDRTDVDRTLTPEEADRAFEDKTIEVVAHAEEAVVGKTAHVTGEVTVGLEQHTREETVGGTVRSTHVDVEQTEGGMDDESHFNSAYGASGRTYDEMRPAYDYGRSARTRHGSGDFASNEDAVRRDYDETLGEQAGDAWDDVKDAVRHGWQSTSRAVS